MSVKKLNVFIHPIDGAGHINACIGLGQALTQRGHEVTVLAGAPFASIIDKFGFKFVLLTDPPKEAKPEPEPNLQVKKGDPLKEMVEIMLGCGLLENKTPLEKMKLFSDSEKNFFDETYKKCVYFNDQIKAEMEKNMPDLFIVDNFLVEPVILQSNIPWISLMSGNPLGLFQSKELPPFCSGFSVNSDKESWKEFFDEADIFGQNCLTKQNDLLRLFNCPEVKEGKIFAMLSDYMNIYGFPEELDYDDVVPIPDNFVRVDAFCRESPVEFKLPEKFKNRINSGDKLVYFSLGSMGSFSVPLMQSIISVLAKTSHKYIVSLGPLHEQYQLPENMWGDAFLPQTALLPMVDLAITHGGNNTVTETFSNGKPMIVMPLFGDQYDNAQRIQDKGFGVRINPFDFDETILIESIDKLLFDTELNQKLRAISERIKQSNSKEKVVIAIEQLVKSHQNKQQ